MEHTRGDEDVPVNCFSTFVLLIEWNGELWTATASLFATSVPPRRLVPRARAARPARQLRPSTIVYADPPSIFGHILLSITTATINRCLQRLLNFV